MKILTAKLIKKYIYINLPTYRCFQYIPILLLLTNTLKTDYESYDTARKNLKKAEETSNLESEEESRKRKLPARLISESDNDTDIESDIEGKTFIINFYTSNSNLALF